MTMNVFELRDLEYSAGQQIQCIDSWSSNLVVGTTEGSLMVLARVQGTEGPKLITTVEKRDFSRRAIAQLAVIESLGLLVTLADAVSVHTLVTLDVRQTLAGNGGNTVAVYRPPLNSQSEQSRPVQICVVCKRKVLVYAWKEKEGKPPEVDRRKETREFVKVQEWQVADIPRSAYWFGPEWLCVGLRKEHVLMNISTGQMISVDIIPRIGLPLCVAINNDELLMARDNVGQFINREGHHSRRKPIQWNDAPVAVGYCFPFVVALQSKGVEIHLVHGSVSEEGVDLAPRLAQHTVLGLTSAGASAPYKSLTCKTLTGIFIANTASLVHLNMLPLEGFIKSLVKVGCLQDALVMSGLDDEEDSNAKATKERDIQLLYAAHLLTNNDFAGAMQHYAMGGANPLQVIRLFPVLGITNELVQRSAPLLPREALAPLPSAAPIATQHVPAAIPPLCQYLEAQRQLLLSSLPMPSGTNGDHHPDPAPALLQDNHQKRTPAHGAPEQLVLRIVDTALVDGLVVGEDYRVLGFICDGLHPCTAHIEDVERILLDSRKYKELVEVFRLRGMHRSVLELFYRLAHAEVERAEQQGWLSSAPAAVPYGVEESIRYMQSIATEPNCSKLLLDFSPWLLQRFPERALRIFSEIPTQLDLDTVLAHLSKFAPHLKEIYLSRLDHVPNPERVIDIMPPETPLSQLVPFVTNVLRSSHEVYQRNLILRQILRAESLQVHMQLMALKNCSVVVTPDRTCPACSKRIGMSVCALNVDGTLMHYFCCKDRGLEAQ